MVRGKHEQDVVLLPNTQQRRKPRSLRGTGVVRCHVNGEWRDRTHHTGAKARCIRSPQSAIAGRNRLGAHRKKARGLAPLWGLIVTSESSFKDRKKGPTALQSKPDEKVHPEGKLDRSHEKQTGSDQPIIPRDCVYSMYGWIIEQDNLDLNEPQSNHCLSEQRGEREVEDGEPRSFVTPAKFEGK